MFSFSDKRIPTVKFDSAKVTPEVEAELKAAIREGADIFSGLGGHQARWRSQGDGGRPIDPPAWQAADRGNLS